MIAYNFSKLKTREKRVYSISDITISKTGIPTRFLIIAGILLAISIIIHIIICNISGNWYIYPMTDDGSLNTAGIIVVYVIPILIAYALYYLKISNYRLIDIILLRLRPRAEISINGNKIQHSKIKFDAFLER